MAYDAKVGAAQCAMEEHHWHGTDEAAVKGVFPAHCCRCTKTLDVKVGDTSVVSLGLHNPDHDQPA